MGALVLLRSGGAGGSHLIQIQTVRSAFTRCGADICNWEEQNEAWKNSFSICRTGQRYRKR